VPVGAFSNRPGDDGEIEQWQSSSPSRGNDHFKIGDVDAVVLYSGAAPTLVLGVVQVNAFVPQGLAAGSASVEVSIGGIRSRAGTTVAISGRS
jgi:uncharacterized protein (TIGR03437 family)